MAAVGERKLEILCRVMYLPRNLQFSADRNECILRCNVCVKIRIEGTKAEGRYLTIAY